VALVAGFALACAGCAPAVMTPPPSPIRSPTPKPAATPSPSPEITPADDPKAPLRDLAHPRSFGTAVLMPFLGQPSLYSDITAEQFDSVTPQNAMTWATLEPSKGELDWAWADSVVEWAASRDIAVRGFPLVWDQQLPAWLTTGTFAPAEVATMLRDHITAMVGRYAGQVAAWDVVTDPINADGSIRRTIWEQALGPDYIARAFEWAHAADPTARLYLQDSGIEGFNTKSDTIYSLVATLRKEGVPIDGVAMEAHLDATKRSPFPSAVVANMQRFGALGLDVVISQLDVRIHSPAWEGDVDRQTSYYAGMVSACFSVPSCSSVTVWGWSDRFSLVSAFYPGEGDADLWDTRFNPKPVLDAVKQAILTSRK
jgi:endo-1,4-beta-xylanase